MRRCATNRWRCALISLCLFATRLAALRGADGRPTVTLMCTSYDYMPMEYLLANEDTWEI